MKHIILIILLCLTTELSAAQRCSVARHNRDEIARVSSPRPPAIRSEIGRPPKVRAPRAWQRLLLLEQQIL